MPPSRTVCRTTRIEKRRADKQLAAPASVAKSRFERARLALVQTEIGDNHFATFGHLAQLVDDDGLLRGGSRLQFAFENGQFLAALTATLDLLFTIANTTQGGLLQARL